MKIINLAPEDEEKVGQTAELLMEAFRPHSPGWLPDMESALREVRESFGKDRISRVAVDDSDSVLGFVGGIREYDGNAWELHPLAVRPDMQRKGIGRALVTDLEQQVKERGGKTVFLGTDDEDYMTSVSGIDLYPDVLAHLVKIQDIKGHPYRFYQEVGFVIVGIIPDANGFGKPDILMAKRVL